MKDYAISGIFSNTGLNNMLYTASGSNLTLLRASKKFGLEQSDDDLTTLLKFEKTKNTKNCALAQNLSKSGFLTVSYDMDVIVSGTFTAHLGGSIERGEIPVLATTLEPGNLVHATDMYSPVLKRILTLKQEVDSLPYVRRIKQFQVLHDVTEDTLRMLDFDDWEVDPALLENYRP